MRQALADFWAFFAAWFRAGTNLALASEQYTEWGLNEATCFNESGKIEQSVKLKTIAAELALPAS